MGRYTGFLGLVVILAFAWLCSSHKRAIQLRTVAWGLGLQFAFALLVLKTPFSQVLRAISGGVAALFGYANVGSAFVFGKLADSEAVQRAFGTPQENVGVIFAFQVLPIIIFIASFFAILYYLGIMQVVVRAMAVAMQKTMAVSGAESLNVAASIFMGQTEAPLTIKPFIAGMTQSELFTIMTCGMAHVSGAVMAAYVKIAGVSIEHLLTAVIMTAPATLLLAKILVPETGTPETAGTLKVEVPKPGVNIIDAAARGAGDGLQLALNIAAMLIAFIALIALVNGCLGWVHTVPLLTWVPPSLQKIFGIVFAPVAWLLGVSWKDSASIGDMLGTRMVLNEFIAFLRLGELKNTLDHRSFVIATFALCGFANFSSIAIQIGGIGALAPTRKSDLARLGMKAMMAGTLANFMTACIA